MVAQALTPGCGRLNAERVALMLSGQHGNSHPDSPEQLELYKALVS
jgi:hypothetical protein